MLNRLLNAPPLRSVTKARAASLPARPHLLLSLRTMASYDASARSAFLSAVQKQQSTDFAEEGSDAAQLSKALQDLKLQDGEQDLKALDGKLSSVTYISNGIKPSMKDVELYVDLHPSMAKLEPSDYYAIPSVTRFFDHIQNLPAVSEARSQLSGTPYALKQFDLDNMPPLERKVEVKEKKAKKGAAPPADAAVAAAPAAESKAAKAEPVTAKEIAAPAADSQQQPPTGVKKEKKVKEKKEKKPAEPAPPPTGPLPSMIDLRVGKVLEVSKHPEADSLYVEKIDLNEPEGPRTVCSGLVNYMKAEQIQDQLVIVVCNLKPVTMRGVKSFAMLLCATSADGKDAGIEFVKPPPGSQAGDRVYFEGEKFENATPEPLLNPKKKVFETIQPGFCTLDTLEAAWVDPETKTVHKIRTKNGVCKVDNFKGASLS